MKRVIFILLFYFIQSSVTMADEQRLRIKFTSQNSLFSFQLGKGNKWQLTNKNGKRLYAIQNHNFTSMTALVSNDGQNIVIVDDFAEGHTIGERKAIWLFHQGQLQKAYKLQELLNDTCNVSRSIWHLGWIAGEFRFTQADSVFELSTNEFYDFEFNCLTGEILKRKRPVEFNNQAIIVYGSFRMETQEETTITVFQSIEGNLKKGETVRFHTKFYKNGPWTEAVMIRNGEDVTPNRYRMKVFISGCQ